ncbi:MAG: hypothetical protein ACYC0V_09305 [Armatimonadota bacterium]
MPTLCGAILPKTGVVPVAHPPYLVGRDGDFTPVIDQLLSYADSHEFIGSAIPFFVLEWGPDTFSAFTGADLTFGAGTSWCMPYVEDWNDVEIRFDRNSKWWHITEDLIGAVRERCDGKLLICPPTIVANLDCLSAIRGQEKLLFDLIERPDEVKKALKQVCNVHTEVLNAYAELLDFQTNGSINIAGSYVSGRQSRPQCDASCLIGPAMFREFVMPCLEYETSDTDAAQYHLDGPGAIRHLDALGELIRLGMIDYTPDPKEKPDDWLHVRRKIDDLGKGQTFYAGSLDEAKKIRQDYHSTKMHLLIGAASRSEAEDIIGEIESISL